MKPDFKFPALGLAGHCLAALAGVLGAMPEIEPDQLAGIARRCAEWYTSYCEEADKFYGK